MPINNMSRKGLYTLTKSNYTSGRQCVKRLYLEVYRRDLATPSDAGTQAVFDWGHRVGRCAHGLYPGGVLIDVPPSEPREALHRTRVAMEETAAPAVFEGAFLFEDVFVRADVMVRQQDGDWLLAECKASTKMKPEHVWDLAVQAHVVSGTGVRLAGTRLVHLNPSFVHPGNVIQARRLLHLVEVTDKVTALGCDVIRQIKDMKRVLAKPDIPVVEPGPHCQTPYPCPYWAHCTQAKPARWVGFLPDGNRQIAQLVGRGIQTMDEIPPEFFLTTIQRSAKYEREWVGESLHSVLREIHFPIHHLHLEAGSPGIPLYRGMRPYDAFPFQWTNLIEEEHGATRVKEWLSLRRQDSRKAWAESLLCSLGEQGTIVVYSNGIPQLLENLAKTLPAQREALRSLRGRLLDLRHLIRKGYYHPQLHPSVYQRESFETPSSIHAVARILPNFKGSALLDGEEGWAFRQYLKACDPVHEKMESDSLRADLLVTSRRLAEMLRDLRLYLETRVREKRGGHSYLSVA